jgi:hypothetical protein
MSLTEFSCFLHQRFHVLLRDDRRELLGGVLVVAAGCR